MPMSDAAQLQVDLGHRGYPIHISSGAISTIGSYLRDLHAGRLAFVISDEHTSKFVDLIVNQLRSSGYETDAVTVPAGESSKSLSVAGELFDRLITAAADRQTVVIAVGGGVVGDLSGFVAATFARGIDFMQVPTSLLSQVDSSVGGKVAVNHHAPDGTVTKNMIGAFHQPIGVLIDLNTLQTLPIEELRSGLAEVVKYGVILDEVLFRFLEDRAEQILKLDHDCLRHIIARSCALKAQVVQEDERETTGLRAILNYGHTFGHAIEALTKDYRHGEAVAMGMVAASRLAEMRGLIGSDITERQIELLETFGLPVKYPMLDPDRVLQAMQRDKKTQAGTLRFILPSRVGEVEMVSGISSEEVRAVLKSVT